MEAYASVVIRRFGENLKRIRKERRIAQEELAKRLGLKRQAQISLWETRDVVPTPATIRRIAVALDCEPWELMEEVETEYDVLRQKAPGRKRHGSR